MKKKFKNFIIALLVLTATYGTVSFYLLHSYYKDMVNEQLRSLSTGAATGAVNISSGLKSYQMMCNTVEGMLVGARQRYDYSMMPYIEHSLQNLVADNNEIVSASVCFEYKVISPVWMRPYGRVKIKAVLKNGLPEISVDTLDIEGEVQTDDYYRFKSGVKQYMVSNPYVKSLFHSNNSLKDDRCVSITVGMSDQGLFLGTVSIELPVTFFTDAVETVSEDSQFNSFVVSSNGKIVNHESEQYNNVFLTDAYPGYDAKGTVQKSVSEGKICSIDFINEAGDMQRMTFFPIKIGQNEKPWCVVSVIPYSVASDMAISRLPSLITIVVVGFGVLLSFLIFISGRSSRPLDNVVDVLHKIESGRFDLISDLKSVDDETSELFKCVNDLAKRMKSTTDFAGSIGKGDLDEDFSASGDKDIMGHALMDMRDNLVRAREEEKNRIEENKKLLWSQNGLAQLGEFLRMNNSDIRDFSSNIICYLVKYLDALQGGMFITEERDGKRLLDQKATYAFDRKKQLENTVEFGESLVGRCAVERKTIYLTEVPEGYLYVSSGLGEKKPACLLLVPLEFEDEILGVVEIASFNELQKYRIDFLNSVAERIASTISNIKKNINTTELLNKFRTQSDELARRAEEVSQGYSNIQKARTEARLNIIETDAIFDIFTKSSIITRCDITGKILDIRDITLPLTGLTVKEVLGKNIREVLIPKNESASFDDLWHGVLMGERRERYFSRAGVKFKEVFTLICDSEGSPYKVVGVAVPEHDISLQTIVDTADKPVR